ncbi:MAG: hypothetical protein AB8B56_17825 [Crocinitomicaceae bacterium]
MATTKTNNGQLTFESGRGNFLDILFPEVDTFLWSVTREEDDITLKVGEGEDEEEKEFKASDIRAFLLKNFNWNGIVHFITILEEKSDRLESYTRPNNLKGTPDDDDELIIPDDVCEAIIYEQAKYAIETKYVDDPSEKIKEILKYADGKPKSDFAKDVLDTTYEKLLQEDDNDEMCYDGMNVDIPDLETVEEDELYDFLRGLSQAKNGLWSDESKVTNFVSIRRDLESKKSKYNDTLFLAWKDGSTKKAVQYIGSTEPGNLSVGQLEPQTTTMTLGFHDTSNCTPSGRTSNAYRKSKSNDSLYFNKGDTTFNVHYASHGINGEDGVGFPAGISEYGLDAKKDGTPYGSNELKAYLIYVGVLRILSKWGAGTDASTCSYDNLKNIGKPFVKTALSGTTDATKKIEIKRDGTVVKTLMLSAYQSYIGKNYSAAAKKSDAITILMEHDSGLSKTDLEAKSQTDLVAELKKEDVFESAVGIQLEHEFNLKKIDACPGGGTIRKINRTATQKAEDKTKYDETVEEAKEDLKTVDDLFTDWDSNSITSQKTALKTKLKEKFKIRVDDYAESSTVDVGEEGRGGKGINRKVNGWSKGCQVIYGGEHFFEFMYLLTQFLPDSKQERWYYTLVDSKNLE